MRLFRSTTCAERRLSQSGSTKRALPARTGQTKGAACTRPPLIVTSEGRSPPIRLGESLSFAPPAFPRPSFPALPPDTHPPSLPRLRPNPPSVPCSVEVQPFPQVDARSTCPTPIRLRLRAAAPCDAPLLALPPAMAKPPSTASSTSTTSIQTPSTTPQQPTSSHARRRSAPRYSSPQVKSSYGAPASESANLNPSPSQAAASAALRPTPSMYSDSTRGSIGGGGGASDESDGESRQGESAAVRCVGLALAPATPPSSRAVPSSANSSGLGWP